MAQIQHLCQLSASVSNDATTNYNLDMSVKMHLLKKPKKKKCIRITKSLVKSGKVISLMWPSKGTFFKKLYLIKKKNNLTSPAYKKYGSDSTSKPVECIRTMYHKMHHPCKFDKGNDITNNNLNIRPPKSNCTQM